MGPNIIIDFIKFIYEHENVHFAMYDAVMGTLILICWLLCENHCACACACVCVCAMSCRRIQILYWLLLCAVSRVYLVLIMVMKKNFSALLDFALLRFGTKLYFMEKAPTKKKRHTKLLIKAIRMCIWIRTYQTCVLYKRFRYIYKTHIKNLHWYHIHNTHGQNNEKRNCNVLPHWFNEVLLPLPSVKLPYFSCIPRYARNSLHHHSTLDVSSFYRIFHWLAFIWLVRTFIRLRFSSRTKVLAMPSLT